MLIKEDLVSIITPTFNSSQTIGITIDSILNQTYKCWELIITDDNSEDNTIELINKFSKLDKRIKVFKLDNNSGAGVARNNSIKQAKGKYIAFCDSDDTWLPEKLRSQIDFMKKNCLAFTYSDYNLIDECGAVIGSIKSPSVLCYNDILKNNYVACLTAIYDQDKLGKVYMSNIRKRQDWTLWIRILSTIDVTLGQNKILANYRIRPNSISTNKFGLIKYNWMVYRKELGLNIFISTYYLVRFLFYYFLKKIIK